MGILSWFSPITPHPQWQRQYLLVSPLDLREYHFPVWHDPATDTMEWESPVLGWLFVHVLNRWWYGGICTGTHDDDDGDALAIIACSALIVVAACWMAFGPSHR
jgi:hypothetical protein